jgi:hypothetical protein
MTATGATRRSTRPTAWRRGGFDDRDVDAGEHSNRMIVCPSRPADYSMTSTTNFHRDARPPVSTSPRRTAHESPAYERPGFTLIERYVILESE